MKSLVKSFTDFRDRIEATQFFRSGLIYILVPCLAIAQWMIVQMCYQSFAECFRVRPEFMLLEAGLLLALDALLALCTGRWWIGFCVTVSFAYIFGVANHYVIELHGTPLSVRDAGNIGTAGEVLLGYKLELSRSVVVQTVILLVCVLMIYVLRRISLRSKPFRHSRVLQRAAALALCVVYIYFGMFAPNSIKPAQTRSWEWEAPLKTYGVISCLLENALNAKQVVLEPEGYSHEQAESIAASLPGGREATAAPDIIFILNETYFDLSLVTDLETDVDPFAALNARSDLIRGYATNPVIAGGTNCSEYELLTGNSLCLSPGITPFQSLDMQGADSVVSRLEAQGYSTLCVNSENENNYYRNTGYPGLGFDEVYFENDFTEREYYADRTYETDECLYRHMIGWYEQMGEGPRFTYLLTIQNHGGYLLCDESTDTVHVKGDYGKYTSEINEYLTSIELSARALDDLIKYFESGDRPVVICMVGDHTNYLARKIISDEYTPEEADLLLRSVPYVIWSNCELDASVIPQRVSLHALGSCVLAASGAELSPYDSYVVEMCRTVPVLLSGGDWYDAAGQRHDSEDREATPQVLQDYYYLLYNNLCGGDRRLENFFCSP